MSRSLKEASRRLEVLAGEADGCRACDLWAQATQAVFGAGPARARIVVVGEQPGNDEDLVGEPFVGPAGKLLDRALADAGLDRSTLYVTNAVKHFKWTPRGKRRIHQRPNRTEIVACHRWLEEELTEADEDAVVVVLGAVAGESLFGPKFRVGAARGAPLELAGRRVVATIHPSAVLRSGGADREAAYAGLVDDLRRARELAT